MDVVDMIMDYEAGELNPNDSLDLFAHLIETGLAWRGLQGSYGRTADTLIQNGYITPAGERLI